MNRREFIAGACAATTIAAVAAPLMQPWRGPFFVGLDLGSDERRAVAVMRKGRVVAVYEDFRIEAVVDDLGRRTNTLFYNPSSVRESGETGGRHGA